MLNFPVYFVAWLLFSSTSPPIHSHGSFFFSAKKVLLVLVALFCFLEGGVRRNCRSPQMRRLTVIGQFRRREGPFGVQMQRREHEWFSVFCLVKDCNDSQRWKTALAANPCRNWANVFHEENPKQNPFIKNAKQYCISYKSSKSFFFPPEHKRRLEQNRGFGASTSQAGITTCYFENFTTFDWGP